MYKVIIVDDDKIIRNDIISLVDWEENGFEVVGEAANGKDALEIINSVHPHLVFTDILMPVMDGIGLIYSIKKNYDYMKFVVLSNYDDFQYVKKALKGGAIDYILKYEITAEELTCILKSVKVSIENDIERKQVEEKLNEVQSSKYQDEINLVWEKAFNSVISNDEINKLMTYTGFPTNPLHGVLILLKSPKIYYDEFFTMMNVTNEAFLESKQVGALNGFVIQPHILGILINYSNIVGTAAIMEYAIRGTSRFIKLSGTDEREYVISLSDVFIYVEDIIPNLKKCRELLKVGYYYPQKDFITPYNIISPFLEEINFSKYQNIIDNIIMHLTNNEPTNIDHHIELLIRMIIHDNIDPDIVIQIYHHIITQLNWILEVNKIKSDAKHSGKYIPIDLLDYEIHIKDVEKKLKTIIREYLVIFKSLYKNVIVSQRSEIQKAISFILDNYSKQLTLQEVADAVGLSKNHFCRLFKQETGKSFVDYLNSLRVNRAEELLKYTDLETHRIPENVGFNDHNYFKKVFLKYTGKKYDDRKKIIY